MSLEYQLHEMPWEEVLHEAVAQGYLSHQAGTCGLHVHVSRKAFGDSYDAQDSAIARVLFFVECHIVLAVGKRVLPVGDVQQRRGVLVVLTGTVDLQLHAEEAGPSAVEDGAGLEVIVVDRAAFNGGAAVAAIGVVVVVGVPALVEGDEASTAGASGIVAVVAVGAKGRGSGVAVVPMSETGAAVGTDLCHAIQAVRAKQTVMELD